MTPRPQENLVRQRSFSLSSFCRLAATGLLLAAQCAMGGAGGFNYQFPNLGSAPPTVAAMAVDAAGNTYVTGNICTATLQATPGAFQTQFGGRCTVLPLIGVVLPGGDAFVMKLDPTGELVWATYLGGSGYDAGNAIAVDSAGNVYVAGQTSSNNFPVTAGAAFPSLTTQSDAFVVKLNPAGSQMMYGTYLPGIAFNGTVSMALDSNGNTYITGGAQPSQFNFPATAGAFQTSSSELYTGVVVKLNPAGSGLVYATYLGGNTGGDRTTIAGIAVDGAGNAYVTGQAPPDFPTTSGALEQQSETAGASPFVTKLNPQGNGLVYSTFLGRGNAGYGLGSAIKVDSQGRAYILGSVFGSVSVPTTPGAFEPAGTQTGAQTPPWVVPYLAGNFLASLSADGSSLVYATYMSGATALDVDPGGDAYVAGLAYNGFPVSAGAFQRCSSGFPGPVIGGVDYGLDGFAAELSPSGALAGATYFGGLDTYSVSAIAIAPGGLLSVAASSPGISNSFLAGFQIDNPSVQDGPCLSPAIANAAGLDPNGYLAPGEFVSLLGVGMGPETGVSTSPGANGLLPTQASGVQVFFDELAAPLLYVQAGQINAQVPWEIAGRSSTQVQVMYNEVATNSESMTVSSVAPGLFYLNYPASLQGAILNRDGSVNSVNNPAKVGDVVAMFGTGGGMASAPGVTGGYWGTGAHTLLAPPFPASIDANSSPAVAYIGQVNAPVIYAGTAPTLLSGFFQVNVRIPPGLPNPPPGQAVVSYDTYVSISPGGSNEVTVAVQCSAPTDCNGRGNFAALPQSGVAIRDGALGAKP
jgi:uncharacterized protein (TIGR03437 family)